MLKLKRKIWFEGSKQIHGDLTKLNLSLENIGEHFQAVISLMPGISNAELLEEGDDYVLLKTNEGIMKRTNISINSENMSTTLEFDEEYQAGNTVTTNAHFRHEFVKSENDLILLLVISDLTAPGFMGFFYKNFGSSTMGQAFLKSYKSYLES